MILVHFHQHMRLPAAGVEDLIGWGVGVLVEQKAGTFAFLFGVGFAVLLRRLDARRAPVVPIYLRPLATLAAFGVIAEVGFGFHILFAYACWGVVLLFIRTWSTRTLLVLAALSACARPVVAELTALHAWWIAAPPTPQSAAVALRQAVDLAARQGDYGALLATRWALFVGTLPSGWVDLLPDINLSLFILGLLAVRHRIVDEPREHLRVIIGWMTFGAVAWASSWLALRHLPAMPVPAADWPLANGLGLLQDQWLCLTYIGAVLLLLAYHPAWTARLRVFAWAGRMALTNYMLQVAVLDVLASGYGLGLRLRPYGYVAAASLLFATEGALSGIWLAHFRFGPLEWVWRTCTYARPQPRAGTPSATGRR